MHVHSMLEYFCIAPNLPVWVLYVYCIKCSKSSLSHLCFAYVVLSAIDLVQLTSQLRANFESAILSVRIAYVHVETLSYQVYADQKVLFSVSDAS